MELDEKEKYDYLFSLADADKDGAIGLQDANFFARSGLQRPILGRVCISSFMSKLARVELIWRFSQIFVLQIPTKLCNNLKNTKLIIKYM